MNCVKCGKKLDDDAKVCNECGFSIDSEIVNQEQENIPVVFPVEEESDDSSVKEKEQEVQEDIPVVFPIEESTSLPAAEVLLDTPPVENNKETKKSNSNKIIVIVVIVILLIVGIAVAIIMLTGSGSSNSSSGSGNSGNEKDLNSGDNGNTDNPSGNNNNNNNSNPGETSEERAKRLLSNISYDMNCDMVQNICLLKVTNNNNENVNAVLSDVRFYDKNNEFLGSEYSPSYANGLGPGESGYISFHSFNFINERYQDTDHFDANYYLQSFNFINHKNDLTYSVAKDDANHRFVLKVKNNSDSIIDSVRISMLFYKNNKLVGATPYCEVHDLNDKYIDYIKPQEEFLVYIEYPFLKGFNGEVINYDKYETVVTEAYEYVDAKDIRYREAHKRAD